MPTRVDYKPRHKKKYGFAGGPPRGPERWARAAHNALRRPRSPAALLFMDRLANARLFADCYEQYDRPIEFLGAESYTRPEIKRKYVACSIHCAVMQVQLDWSTTDRNELQALLEDGELFRVHENADGRTWMTHQYHRVRPLDRKTLRRTVQCIVCGSGVSSE